MSYNYFLPVMYFIIKLALLITITTVVFRDQGQGKWLMAIGVAMFLAGTVGIWLVVVFEKFARDLYMMIQPAAILGEMLFVAGVLLYVLDCRNRQKRIEQLETILADKMERSD